MTTMTRKQREIQEREGKILDVARTMLVEGGYHGLTMDRIAESLEYGKGTIYNHFGCKEEIIIALVNQTMVKRTDLFRKAATFRGLPRERLCAVGVASELFMEKFPNHFKVEQLIRSSSLWEKTSEERRFAIYTCESTCIGIVGGLVRDGIAQGHLKLPANYSPEELVFGLWSTYYGAFTLVSTGASLPTLGIHDPLAAIRRLIHASLDGFHWEPLSHLHDYDAIYRRIQKEVFANEYAQSIGS
ncbi:MAG: TetR/AcrR family transcriptional regulator [Bdellovibrionales bacterium]